MAVAILPLATAAVAGYFYLGRGVLGAVQDVATRQRNEIVPVQHLGLLLWDAVPALDGYVAEGDPANVTAYRAARQRIEAEFAAIHGALGDDRELRTALERARDAWTEADAFAGEALGVRSAARDPSEELLMDRFHERIQAADDRLESLQAALTATIFHDHDVVLRDIERSRWLAAIAAGVSTLAILAGVLLIGRIISGSVERLVDGAERFAAGDRDHRIDVQVPPELHRVAEEFNVMISRIHASEDALADQARRDSLTLLLNRRAFDEELQGMLARQKRFSEGFALLSFDLDGFKRINDTHGHAGGDAVLRATARALSEAVRPFDRVFRIGGEEFAALLAGSDRDAAVQAAERLRMAIAANPALVDGSAVPVTASVGVAVASDAATADALLRAADAALYRAKAEGRDRVVVGDP
jgi:diguanylate cyclase (GGDEF)-like protein